MVGESKGRRRCTSRADCQNCEYLSKKTIGVSKEMPAILLIMHATPHQTCLCLNASSVFSATYNQLCRTHDQPSGPALRIPPSILHRCGLHRSGTAAVHACGESADLPQINDLFATRTRRTPSLPEKANIAPRRRNVVLVKVAARQAGSWAPAYSMSVRVPSVRPFCT